MTSNVPSEPTPPTPAHLACIARHASTKRIQSQFSTRRPKRGDVWFVGSRSTDAGKGSHWSVGTELWSNAFAVIVSNDRMNATSGFVQLVYVSTSSRRKPTGLHVAITLPAHPVLPAEPGDQATTTGGPGGTEVSQEAVVLCEQMHSVDLSRLYSYHGRVGSVEMGKIEEAVRWSLGLQHTLAA
ncbi:type II toxin-antitoxin system PemK/MazF family toxin [Arthrobacter bambusae]|uniref:mRNA-degrading endonuclease toxin of MazEF toxin-antitoxin module n=1 Tax=Arthrobacter bambusae TaxID=1338426 RepID=A0AAW8DB75_9MICC|nr:type II toxin-antitoxin system PemK/MazF family toxin [Arthrobacter bambusae]MDP9903186.1 mRNA-degrading endonuclease toxin of MazEF toxin-antitoxin module [Arthrobacter bambusae]MDQ0128820.1 mRNA-degrading endonuclease toxin of MazEF toxin-antitoxin module [Arthrobacter bambusae]MDQ0180161.1 mRNA-degrading endonuclease toxin of MazEF toxin-antitoxin module [Arthrobacter bambusae]